MNDATPVFSPDLADTGSSGSLEIAITGMACRFPGGLHDTAALWRFLLGKGTSIREIPADRWALSAFHDDDPEAIGKSRARWAGFLDDPFAFDPDFFEISPREALAMDPQQRLLLEVAYEALQDARTPIAKAARGRTGVFVGISTSDFATTRRFQRTLNDGFAGTGTALSIAANRVSHRFNFTGPSLVIDTACSSSLVALDQACRSLATGACDSAVVAGVHCLLDPAPFIAFSKANMLSPTGALYAFDSRGDGFVRGEGCGAVILKPLAAAVADGDCIHAVIRATAVRQDGRTSTLTAPSREAQHAMLADAAAAVAIDPAEVGYVEAHGTGTPVGDPIEAHAIGRVFGRPDGDVLHFGSIKPNLGHLEPAAGIAGLIKAVLSLRNGTIAPNRNFAVSNPAIPMELLNIAVPTAAMPFPAVRGRRTAVVNSFGFGGTGACAILQSHRAPRRIQSSRRFRQLGRAAETHAVPLGEPAGWPVMLPLSAPSRDGLSAWADRLAGSIADAGEASIPAYAGELAHGRDHFSERCVVLSSGQTETTIEALRSIGNVDADDAEHALVIRGRARAGRKLAFTFSGQGAQWWAMGRDLLQREPVFRRAVQAFDGCFQPLAGWSVLEALLAAEAESRVDESAVTQASLVALQLALAALWRDRGVVPDLVLGHSLGEISAACVAGAISLETTARIIHKRGMIPHQAPERGAMAVLGLTVEEITPLLPDDDSVLIGAENAPGIVTVTGRAPAVATFLDAVRACHPDAMIRAIRTDFAWHSALLDHGRTWFEHELGEIRFAPPAIPFASTVEPGFQLRFDLDYWWRNLRRPVLYQRGIEFCLDFGIDTFLEIGPHRTLTPLTKSISAHRGRDTHPVASLVRGANDLESVSRAAALLHVNGIELDWSRISPDQGSTDIPLPAFPWRHRTLRSVPAETEQALLAVPPHPLLGIPDFGPKPAWTGEISTRGFAYFKDHALLGNCIVPAAAFVEIMVAAVRAHSGREKAVELRSVRFHEAIPLGPESSVILKTGIDTALSKVSIFAFDRDSDAGWRLCADAYGIAREAGSEALAGFELPARRPDLESADFYELTRRHGYGFGPAFQRLEAIWVEADDLSVAKVSAGAGASSENAGYHLHPCLLDAAFQSALVLFDKHSGDWTPGVPLQDTPCDPGGYPLQVPVGIDSVVVFGRAPRDLLVRYRSKGGLSDGVYDIADESGNPVARIERVRTDSIAKSADTAPSNAARPEYYRERFDPHAPDVCGSTPASGWIIVTEAPEQVASLAATLAVPRAEIVAREELVARLSSFDREHARSRGIIYAPALGLTLDEPPAGDELGRIIESQIADLIEVATSCRGEEARRDFVLVTNSARQAPTDLPMPTAGLLQTPLVGCLRTVANESPALRMRMIDVDDAALADPGVLAVCISSQSAESEYVLRGRECSVPRIERVAAYELPPLRKSLQPARDKANFGPMLTHPGSFDNIELRELATPEPGPDEILVEVAAVGLNFRDVLAATSLLPDELSTSEAWWRNLGFEAAGTVVRTGERVENFRPGDRVMGFGKGLLRRFACIDARLAAPVPAGTDFTTAASVPIAFLTAEYALSRVARLDRGERVLIHLASGGVGLAAIQVARRCGAEIFATAGTEAKRDYLRGLGIRHIMDSRSLDFADQIAAITGGRGVDVVLNSLSGQGIDKGLQCLAPFGRFVEIGKRDLAADKPMGLRALYNNNSFAVVDLAAMMSERPELLRRELDHVVAHFAAGTYHPVPTTSFPASRTADALRYFGKGQHIGKVLVAFEEDEVTASLDLTSPLNLRRDRSYLVTGGLKGFGLATAEWMSERGAGRLLLASRSGAPDPEDAEALARIEANGCEAVLFSLDVANEAAVEALVGRHIGSDKPLAGIIHAAAVIDDAMLDQLDRTRIERVIRPKAVGAWNLHRALEKAGHNPDFFVSYSSISELLGVPGQANYVAANAFLNGLSAFRRSRGSAGTAVAWGALGESGFVARSDAHGSYFRSAGVTPLSNAAALAALEQLIRADIAAASFAAANWPLTLRTLGAPTPRLGALAEERVRTASRLADRLTAAQAGEHERIICEVVRDELGRVLKIDAAHVSFDLRLTELGLDSLSSFELKNRIESAVGLTFPVTKFIQTPTIAGIAKMIAEQFAEARKAAEGPAQADDQNARTDSAGIPALPRQRAMLHLAGRPGTSAETRRALVLTRVVETPGLSAAELASLVERVARRHDCTRLTASLSATGKPILALADQPSITISAGEFPVKPAPDGPLWRFTVWSREGGGSLVAIAAHRAAADHASLDIVAGEIGPFAEEKTPVPAGSWLQWAAAAVVPEHGADYIRHYAFWSEFLSRVAEPAEIPGRSRGPELFAAGLTRRRMEGVAARIDRQESGDRPPVQEAALLAAFCTAVGREFGCDALVVERHAARQAGAEAPLVGPVGRSLPLAVTAVRDPVPALVAQVGRLLAMAERHKGFDTAAIEEAIPLVPGQAAALRQFGFCITNAAEDFIELAGEPWNEIRLNICATIGALHAQLVYDPDVLPADRAERLLGRIAAEIGSMENVGRSVLEQPAPDILPAVNSVLHPAAAHTVELTGTPQRIGQPAANPIIQKTASFPVSMQQDFLLSALQDERTTETFRRFWVIARAYLIRPRIDVAQLRGILANMVGRHESLRSRFAMVGERFVSLIETNAAPVLSVEDLGDVDAAAIQERVDALTAAPLDPLVDPLYAVTVLRCGKHGDVLHCRGHHSIVDGWSMSLLVEELIAAALGMPLPPATMSVGRYLEKYDRSRDAETRRIRDGYFRDLFHAAPPVPLFGRTGRQSRPNVDLVEAGPGAEMIVLAGKDGANKVADAARRAEVSETALLLASVAKTISERSHRDDVTICLPASMRTGAELRNYVGWVATVVPVRCRTCRIHSLDALARDILRQYQTSLEYLPADFTLRRGKLHRELSEGGSYLTLYEAGMQTVDSLYRASPLAALHRPSGEEQMDFGPVKVTKLSNGGVRTDSIFELDIRSFDHNGVRAYRCGYDTTAFAGHEVSALFEEVLDRIGVQGDLLGTAPERAA